MSILVPPIHAATINGKPVRFFVSPLKDGRPDFPWHCVGDLMSALMMDQPTREHFFRSLRDGPTAVVVSIPTDSGIVQVCPHFMAQGLVDAMVAVGVAPKKSRKEYDNAIFEAGEAHMEIDCRVGGFEHTIAAFKRWEGEAS